jgi:hypothetical protein
MLETIHLLVLIKALNSPLGVGPTCLPWQTGVSGADLTFIFGLIGTHKSNTLLFKKVQYVIHTRI